MTYDTILKTVCSHTYTIPSELTKDNTISGARIGKYITARAFCMLFCREYKLGTFEEIGKFFGNRNHATVMYAVKTIQQEIELYPEKKLLYYLIKQTLTEIETNTIINVFKMRMETELNIFIERAKSIRNELMELK